eukprot:14923706-Ditylum_brightwellii.AAC.2
MSEPKACSRAGGHFFMSEDAKNLAAVQEDEVPTNGPVHAVCKTIRNIMALSTEAELGALFINSKKGEKLQMALGEMGHVQPPMLIMTDNSTACGIINRTVKQRRTRVIDMHFYWVCNHCAQHHFTVYWSPSKNNLGNYYTKHHPAAHHQHMRRVYLYVASPVAYATKLSTTSSL